MTRLLLLLGASVALSGCPARVHPAAPTAPTPAPTPSDPPPAVTSLMHGIWGGFATKSPLGEQPYAMTFRAEDGQLMAESTLAMGEEGLVPGAYQRFVFPQGPGSARLRFVTAMGSKGMREGELDLQRAADPTRVAYCEPTACESMEFRWIAIAKDRMKFQVYIHGILHVDISLQFTGDL